MTARAPRGKRKAGPARDLAALARVRLLPVRHHSPRVSHVVEAELDRWRPARVLIEGPVDAIDLAPVLVDPDTRPPVAILGYRTDGPSHSVVWPFASFSPEYVALRWAAANGVPAAFIDLDVGTALAVAAEEAGRGDGDGSGDGSGDVLRHGPRSRSALLRMSGGDGDGHGDGDGGGDGDGDGSGDGGGDGDGDGDGDGHGHGHGHGEGEPEFDSIDDFVAASTTMRSLEELWDSYLEAPAHAAGDLRSTLLAYAHMVTARGRGSHRSRDRDAVMAARILDVIDEGVAPEDIAVVVGAAHAAAFLAGDVDLARAAPGALPPPVPAARTLIPYSFPRLSDQARHGGYGAGTRAPRYYQRAHDAGADFAHATLQTLIEVGDALRLRGFAVSLADTIEAWRLAVMLATLRGKPAPGLDEAREAAIATMGRGEAGPVDAVLDVAAVGRAIGKVAARLGEGPLQAEFWREVRGRRLPAHDEPTDLSLSLVDDVQVGASVFLHRLRVAEVPYASFRGVARGRAAGGDPEDTAGGLDALTRVREAWTAQWTPATDIALVEKVVLGDSLEDVAAHVLGARLAAARGTGEAADVLLEAVVAGCAAIVDRALAACDDAAAHDDDLPSLARACAALSALTSYGGARGRAADPAIARLCVTTFDRAVLRLPGAAIVDDGSVDAVGRALRALHEVALAQPRLADTGGRDAWLAAARDTADSFDVHPAAAGLAAGLLYLAQALDDDALATAVSLRLSRAVAPAAAAAYLAGFLEVNALVLVKSRPVVAALDAFLAAIPPEAFADVLPVLRRALAALGATERRYLLDNVIAIRGIGAQARAAAAVIAETDKARLAALGGDLAAALDDLDDLL